MVRETGNSATTSTTRNPLALRSSARVHSCFVTIRQVQRRDTQDARQLPDAGWIRAVPAIFVRQDLCLGRFDPPGQLLCAETAALVGAGSRPARSDGPSNGVCAPRVMTMSPLDIGVRLKASGQV